MSESNQNTVDSEPVVEVPDEADVVNPNHVEDKDPQSLVGDEVNDNE